MKLTPKQELFITEYCIDLNATRAYKEVYKVDNDNTAAVNANRLLRNAKVKTEIDKRLVKRANDNGVTADMVLGDLMELKDKCLGRKPITQTITLEDGKTIDVTKTIFDASGAKASLELLGKHLKLFTDKVEANVDGTQQLNINFNIPRPKKV